MKQSLTDFERGLVINGQFAYFSDSSVNDEITAAVHEMEDIHDITVRVPFRHVVFTFSKATTDTQATIVTVGGATVATFGSLSLAADYIVDCQMWLDRNTSTVVVVTTQKRTDTSPDQEETVRYQMSAGETTTVTTGDFDVVATNVDMDNAPAVKSGITLVG